VISAPPDVTVTRWVRHADVLPHCSAVITHGGHGTVMKALIAGARRLNARGDPARIAARAGLGTSRWCTCDGLYRPPRARASECAASPVRAVPVVSCP
jgi:glutamine amidotransferase PdxT